MAALAVTASLCFVAFQAGLDMAQRAAVQDVEKLRGERDALRAPHDAALAGLARAEHQLRLSQQAYAELSAAIEVSHRQITQMRAELDAVRKELDTGAKTAAKRSAGGAR
jgi:chromosome segregation ATPase